MIYFLLPSVHSNIFKYINYEIDENPSAKDARPFVSDSLSIYLYDIKHKIQLYNKDWDSYKKYTNPFEYINTVIPQKTICVAKYKPLSRSYFKMLEILLHFQLYYENEDSIQTFHLAEGPGGFIEAIVNHRNCPDDKYIGMTILEDTSDENIPAWKKSDYFLKKNPNVFIENGKDNTGNILSLDNFAYCKDKYKSSMHLITADGGFDFSYDYNNQESNIIKLLFAQIAYAICMQKRGGVFVLKIFDSFMQFTVDVIYLLSSCYEKVYITKPQTSRYANSEKYIVCKHFVNDNCDEIYPFLYSAFENMVKSNALPKRFLSITPSNYFLNRLEEFNAIFGQQQIENIHNTILLINNKNKLTKIENLIKTNIQKSIQWCLKHNVKHNVFTNGNVFLRDNN